MIRCVSGVVFWLLLVAGLLTGPGASLAEAQFPQTCSWNGCPIDMSASTYAVNNLWNKRKARGSQSITVNSPTAWSTSWDWTRREDWTVTSFASTVTGWHWGWHFTPQATKLPVPVIASTPVNATFAYNYLPDSTCWVSRPCRYDVAFDLWFHDTATPVATSNPVFELMIWTSYWRADMFIGYPLLLTDVVIGKDSTGVPLHWNVVQTASTNAVLLPTATQADVTSATLNVTDFINAIVSAGLGISSSWYLSSVEFGIEVYKGRGTLNVTNYGVSVGQ